MGPFQRTIYAGTAPGSDGKGFFAKKQRRLELGKSSVGRRWKDKKSRFKRLEPKFDSFCIFVFALFLVFLRFTNDDDGDGRVRAT